MIHLTRRAALALSGAALTAVVAAPARAAAPNILVHRNPSCSCCGVWADRLRSAGFTVEIVNEESVGQVKERLGVPAALASCHTAEAGGYVLEGHVPVAAIERLFREQPKAIGLAVPGMPKGSPGMEREGQNDVYEVFLFGGAEPVSWGKFSGGQAL